MTESEWTVSQSSYPMLRPCRRIIREQPRKGRLFAVACCRRIWDRLADPRSRKSVDVAALYADALATQNELIDAAEGARLAHAAAFKESGKRGAAAQWAAQFAASPDAWHAANRSSNFAYVAAGDDLKSGPEHAAQADLLRCIFGPLPFRDVSVDLRDLGAAPIALAETIYRAQEFGRMPELAAALEAAGCTNPDIITHCRAPGSCVRGCWVIDLLLATK